MPARVTGRPAGAGRVYQEIPRERHELRPPPP